MSIKYNASAFSRDLERFLPKITPDGNSIHLKDWYDKTNKKAALLAVDAQTIMTSDKVMQVKVEEIVRSQANDLEKMFGYMINNKVRNVKVIGHACEVKTVGVNEVMVKGEQYTYSSGGYVKVKLRTEFKGEEYRYTLSIRKPFGVAEKNGKLLPYLLHVYSSMVALASIVKAIYLQATRLDCEDIEKEIMKWADNVTIIGAIEIKAEDIAEKYLRVEDNNKESNMPNSNKKESIGVMGVKGNITTTEIEKVLKSMFNSRARGGR